MYIQGHTYRNVRHRELHELLCQEMEKRAKRKDWVTAERTAMWNAVNRHRTQLGKKPITVADVERVEQMAVGHSDYGTKFALYCTELVENQP